MFTQKCCKLAEKIKFDKKKENYEQTHIPVDISL